MSEQIFSRSAGSSCEAVVLPRFGNPLEVAVCNRVPVGSPSDGEVLVSVDYAPINPADINVLEGKYGSLPALPAVPGVEGVGTVVESRAVGFSAGQRVLLPGTFGTWREHGVVEASLLIPVPDAIPAQQAAMARINPATAYCMLREFESLEPGDWVVQNAANSGVGRSVLQIAKIRGLRTINVVRRGGLESELMREGADVVLEDGAHLAERIREAAGSGNLRLGLNAVGGESALELAKALSDSGTLVTYGAMARQPLRIPNGLLIFKNLRFCGFWVSRWYREAPRDAVSALFSDLFTWIGEGKVRTPVEAVYPLERIREALEHACRQFRGGKILLHPGRGPNGAGVSE
jgi:trans-2-enoyl-CoA reductase